MRLRIFGLAGKEYAIHFKEDLEFCFADDTYLDEYEKDK